MKYAASLGVATRREDRRNWRRVDEVRADCEVKLAQRASTLDVHSSSQEASEFDGLLIDDLRARAKGLGVTTRVGSKWRTAAELRRACVEKTKALHALPEACAEATTPTGGLRCLRASPYAVKAWRRDCCVAAGLRNLRPPEVSAQRSLVLSRSLARPA